MIKDKLPKAAAEASVPAKATEPKKSSFDWLSILFKLSALFLFGVYVYGYGAAVGYAGYFGIPQSALYSSSTDLLGIASETLLHHIFYFFKDDVYSQYFVFLKSNSTNLIFIGIVTFIASFASISFYKSKKAVEQTTALLIKAGNIFLPTVKTLLDESTIATAIRSIGYSILSVIIYLTAQTILIIAIFISFSFVFFAAILGYYAAMNHAEQDIIRPAKCDAMHTRVQFIDTLEKQRTPKLAGIKDTPMEHTANCVKVTFSDTKGSKTIAGRSVIAGSDYILVYELSGKTTRIPIKTAVIEAANDAVLKEVELQNGKLLAINAR